LWGLALGLSGHVQEEVGCGKVIGELAQEHLCDLGYLGIDVRGLASRMCDLGIPNRVLPGL
jgi:hypothetical protein